MKIALSAIKIESDIDVNAYKIFNSIKTAAYKEANLILFPEASLTGLINNDNPEHDLDLGIEIPGMFTDLLEMLSKDLNIYIGIGLLERDENKLFDSAILIAPKRGIILKYRRISPGWHGQKANSSFYREGAGLSMVKTEFGNFMFLICGDLFDDEIVARVSKLKPDWLLYPFARSFEDGKNVVEKWENEKKYYTERVKMIGTTGLMVNYIADDGSFGGAMVVSPEGGIKAELPVGKEGILFAEL